MTIGETEGHELRFEYLLEVPRANVWRCWSESTQLEQWFHPPSWATEVKSWSSAPEAHRASSCAALMARNSMAKACPGSGTGTAASIHQRLQVGLDPSAPPSGAPLRTMIIEMSGEDGRTRYVVHALHWTEEARKQHEETGFHEGWKHTSRQLEALARTL